MRIIQIHDNRRDDADPVFESSEEQEIIDWFANVYPEFREFYCTENVEVENTVPGLLFERFLSSERDSPPDIDLGFNSNSKD